MAITTTTLTIEVVHETASPSNPIDIDGDPLSVATQALRDAGFIVGSAVGRTGEEYALVPISQAPAGARTF